MIIRFHGNLKELLRLPHQGRDSITHALGRQASVKDIIEAFGVPHVEVGRLTVAGREIPFSRLGRDSDTLEVYPLRAPVDVLTPTLLRPHPLPALGFAVDMNVGKLAALLRMAGFDTFYLNEIADSELARIAEEEGRILLSRDRALLKRKEVEFGHLVREIEPSRQLVEIVELFGLRERFRPLSRCLRCNGILQPVAKQQIIDRLEPLTRKYYDSFHQCPDCRKIYWPGTHRDRMMALLHGFFF